MEAIVQRLGRVLRLEPSVFDEIGADIRATGEAIAVTAVATAISNVTGDGNPIALAIGGAIFGVLGLTIWTGIVYLIGKLFSGAGSYQSLMRGIGYSAAPFAIGIVPVLGIIGTVYSIVLQVRAVKEINGVSGGAAAATVLLPWAVLIVVSLILLAALVSALFGVAID